MKRTITFSPPDITQREIDEVVDTLKSGWITTGPKTKLFEKKIAEYCETEKAVCFNSATAAMELTLRLFDIGPGDEVITSAYTYTASASVILHVGATPVLVDIKSDSFLIDSEKIKEAITEKTKAIIPVDIGGMPADYDEIFKIVEEKKGLFNPKKGTLQEKLGRILILADAAHSFGATYKGSKIGSVADFSSFSFHAVKNLTTAEGGALTWKENKALDNGDMYKQFMLLSLHGQNKDALSKMKAGAWKYDIAIPGYKCNMTDINAAIGLAQLERYDSEILVKKEKIVSWYKKYFKDIKGIILPEFDLKDRKSSKHIYALRLVNKTLEERNKIIIGLAEEGIATNVHYQPLPLFTAYKNLGYKMEDYPISYAMSINEISMPFHNMLKEDDIKYIAKIFKGIF
ncbi:MAG: DegT/DnrJ/EryC1/StrS family aminotransferase [Fusobacterium sp. JB019]|nr:DegT/DnrJ/EryC1/StrS family aminotransferase [Fusobacterium sp. JB019]